MFGSHLLLDLGVVRGCAAKSFQYPESSSEVAFPDEVEALVEASLRSVRSGGASFRFILFSIPCPFVYEGVVLPGEEEL